jgi:hypothetical protein
LIEILGAQDRAGCRARLEQYDAFGIRLDDQRQGTRSFLSGLVRFRMRFCYAGVLQAWHLRPEHSKAGQGNALDFVRGARMPLCLEAQGLGCLKVAEVCGGEIAALRVPQSDAELADAPKPR